MNGISVLIRVMRGFPGGSDSEESACNAGEKDSVPGLGRSPGEENSYSLQYSLLENSMDRGAWQAPVHGFAKSWTQLSDFRSFGMSGFITHWTFSELCFACFFY